MKEILQKNSSVIFIGVVIITAFSRLIVHPWNLTPVGAMAIFSGAYLGKGYIKYLVPLGAYWLSDLVVMNTIYASYYKGFQWFGSLGVFVALACIIGLSAFIFSKVKKSQYLSTSIPTALLMSVVFFLISNGGSWIADPAYPKNLVGLMSSYAAGLPFFQGTLVSYLFYTAILFGLVHLAKRVTVFGKATT